MAGKYSGFEHKPPSEKGMQYRLWSGSSAMKMMIIIKKNKLQRSSLISFWRVKSKVRLGVEGFFDLVVDSDWGFTPLESHVTTSRH